MVMTLIVLGAMMTAFRTASNEISKGRAMIELSNQMRMMQEELRTDLEGVTVDMRNWSNTASPNGYFELIEGAGNDLTSAGSAFNMLGDVDDIMAMTVRGKTFRGRINPAFVAVANQMFLSNGTVESQMAEVIWWADHTERDGVAGINYDESVRVCRRALLIRPDLVLPVPVANWNDVWNFFRQNDISMRVEMSGGAPVRLVPNTLEDLAKRECRFAHWADSTGAAPYVYPYPLYRAHIQNCEMTSGNMGGMDSRFIGSDIKLNDVLAFDIQVFSPDAPINVANVNGNLIPLTPDDPAYAGYTGNEADRGDFVDLGYGNVNFDPTLVQFSTYPRGVFRTSPLIFPARVYDTFSKHYESNGIDDDGIFAIDQGINGFDDDGLNGVDDVGERETAAPYPFRLQGIKVTIRTVHRTTKQVRQTNIVHSFVPR
jgi:hypothetical protein